MLGEEIITEGPIHIKCHDSCGSHGKVQLEFNIELSVCGHLPLTFKCSAL